MAINVSNRDLGLETETYRLAQTFNLESALSEDKGDGIKEKHQPNEAGA